MTEPFVPLCRVPARLTAGTFWSWREPAVTDDPADVAASWTFRPEDGGAGVTFAATADGSHHLVEVASAATAAWAAGRYVWAKTFTRASDGETTPAGSGVVEVLPATDATADARSVNRRILDAITARLEGRITKDAESYTIEGRSISRTPLEVLEKLRTQYSRRVAREEGRGGVRWSKAKMR